MLAALVLVALQERSAYYSVPVEELELAPGQLLPQYDLPPWEHWDRRIESQNLPRAVIEGAGEVVVHQDDQRDFGAEGRPAHELGVLCVRTDAPRDVAGTLYLPKASGEGFLRIGFRIPAARATASEKDFLRAELHRYLRLLRLGVPGGAWYRHRYEELRTALGPEPAPDPESDRQWRQWIDFRDPADTLELFSGGRALYENLQLERGLPASAAGEATVALDTLAGVTVKALDWKTRLAAAEPKLDALAGLIPADQHALFFPSFPSFVAALDEADRLGTFGLSAFEERSSDARTRERYERQLGLELSALARTFGPLVVESVALTGSDPYLRTGSDVALFFRCRTPEVVEGYVRTRQEAAAGTRTGGKLGKLEYRGVVDGARSVSSYVARNGDTVVVTNSLAELERIAAVAGGAASLATKDEYRFFRQRYALGSEGESALVVLPDDAIRRWCSPRWRIASARIARAASELSEEHAAHVPALASGAVAERDLGVDADFPDLGALRLTKDGVQSANYGTLDFMTPVAELPLDKVTEREATLYRTWREGYESAWSNFFDPIGARVSVSAKKTAVDLTVMPLILGTEYADLRRVVGDTRLEPGSGDPHPEALVHFVIAVDPEWEQLRSIGSILGSSGEKLGADLLGWLGTWVAIYADDGPFWDDLLQAEDPEEALLGVQNDLNELPLVVEVAVKNPLKLALFMTSLRVFVDGTAPGMTEWKERVEGERRFVEVTSPGIGQEFSLFYATTPSALLLSLNEPALLAAMAREERGRTGGAGGGTPPWSGAQLGLELRGRGLEVLELLFDDAVAQGLRRDSWRNLPILNEWHRLYPDRDPVQFHEQVFRERLVCPGGGSYVWDADWNTMESSVFGHPGAPQAGTRRPPGWGDLAAARFALEFEQDGLRVRAEIERK